MAKLKPDAFRKINYLFFLIVGIIFIFLDENTNLFEPQKNSYNQLIRISSEKVKTFFFDRPKLYIDSSSMINDLRKENKLLKKQISIIELNKKIDEFTNFNNDKKKTTKSIKIAKIIGFDHQNYFCCDQHRVSILLKDSFFDKKYPYSVFNSKGIIGQTMFVKDNYAEVILLTDASHSLPIYRNNFYCLGKGFGKKGKIRCRYDSSLFKEEIKLNHIFYTSGLGGVYPKGIEVGEVQNIDQISDTLKDIYISLKANPLSEATVGVLNEYR